MKILIACEYSGIVREAFTAKGHKAISCDLLPTEKPGEHYQGSVLDILNQKWDMMIAFPPCTYLSYAGLKHWNNPGRKEKREEALEFVRLLMNADIPQIAIENPRGCITKEIRREDQVIHPWMFGHQEQKRTCLWLKGLPPLMATCVELNRKEFVNSTGGTGDKRRLARSKTFPGIARAMADQWG